MSCRDHIALVALACALCLSVGMAAPAQTAPAQSVLPGQASWADSYGWYGIDAPTSTEYELDEIFAPHTGMFKVPLLDDPTNWLIRQQQELFEKTGLRIGFAYTALYQQASGGPGDRSASAGDLDLMFDWTLIGRGTKNTGRFVFTVEERYKSCEIPPSQLRNEIGSLVSTTGVFNDRGLVVRDAFWEQRLFEDRLRIVVGRAAPDDYAGAHRLQSSVFGFFNGNLSGNVTTPWPGHGPLAMVSTRPTDQFYVTAGACNAYSTTTQIQISSLDEGKIFGFGEAGFTPMIQGMGRGRYALTAWHMSSREDPDRPSDTGFSVTAEQYLTDILWVMGRFGCSDKGSTGVGAGMELRDGCRWPAWKPRQRHRPRLRLRQTNERQPARRDIGRPVPPLPGDRAHAVHGGSAGLLRSEQRA